MEKTTKRRFGDRKDGVLLRDLDGMHFITPIIYPNRCDNEAYLSETIDLTNMNAYLEKKNAEQPGLPLHDVPRHCRRAHQDDHAPPEDRTALSRIRTSIRETACPRRSWSKSSLRTKRQRRSPSSGKDESTLDTIHGDLRHQIMDCKDMTKTDTSTDFMDIFNRMPRFLGKFIVWLLTRLDVHGWIPASIIETDPYYCTVVISNLGSIKLHSGYHHLTNWGTCSVFCIIGEILPAPGLQTQTVHMKCTRCWTWALPSTSALPTGTIIPRPSGCFATLLENPELLETPANQEIEY